MRLILTAVTLTLVLLLNACGHRTMLTLPNAKGKPPAINQADTIESRDAAQP